MLPPISTTSGSTVATVLKMPTAMSCTQRSTIARTRGSSSRWNSVLGSTSPASPPNSSAYHCDSLSVETKSCSGSAPAES